MVGVEECGGRGKVYGERGGGVWEGVRCVGRGGGVWEEWRGVGGVEECGGRGKVCRGRGGSEFGRGGVWVGQVSRAGQSR